MTRPRSTTATRLTRLTRLAGLVGIVGLASATLVAPTASAAPSSSPQTVPIESSCPALGEGTFTIAPPPGNGDWTPGFIVGTDQVLVPYVFTFTFSDGTTTETETTAKKGPLPAGSVTCTFGETFVEDGVTYTFVGTATGPLRGRP